IHPTGVLPRAMLLRELHACGVRWHAGLEPVELDAILGIRGDRRWVCLPGDRHSTLASKVRRIVAALGPIPLDRLPVPARPPPPRQPAIYGPWPPPLPAIRVWAAYQPAWHVTEHTIHAPPGTYLRPRPADIRIREALKSGPLGWTCLRDALVAAGMPAPAAA